MKKFFKKTYNKIKNDIKHLNQIIKYVYDKENTFVVITFFDVLWCKLKYGIMLDEYKHYEFYKINSTLRESYLTNRKHNKFCRRIIDYNITDVILNKKRFIKRFEKTINREILNVNDLSYKQFEDILLENKKIICRSTNDSFNESYQVYNLDDYRGAGFILEKIKSNKLYLVEKMFSQHKLLNNINEDLVMLNIVTLTKENYTKVVSSFITFKDSNKVVYGNIDIKESKVKGRLRFTDGKTYNENVINYEIPHLDASIEYAKKLALELEEIGEVTWSFGIDNRGRVHLFDASLWNQYYLSQIPEYLNRRVGILSKYREI